MHQKKPIQFKVSQIKMKDSDVAKGNARSVLKQKVSNFSDNDISAIVSDVNTDCEVVLIDEDDF